MVIMATMATTTTQTLSSYWDVRSVILQRKNGKVNINCRIYQILETGSRVAKGLELSWKSWTNVGVLIAYLQEVICNFLPEILIYRNSVFSTILLCKI